MAAPRKKRNLCSTRSEQKADVQMQFRRIWERQKQVRSVGGDRLDVLVLNAGTSKPARIADHTIEDFDNRFATNVRGPFFLAQQLLPILGESSNIVVISSLGAHMVGGQARLRKPVNSCLHLYQRCT
jgi:NAD(P)-dependent dehydrogenase (short-subunit alcohol dehydrogenase family)